MRTDLNVSNDFQDSSKSPKVFLDIFSFDIATSRSCEMLGLGHETMVCAVCLSVFLWICDMAGLLRGIFVSWWYLPRIWPSVTDMQLYHPRYPTDDWHLAYMFSLVYFSVEMCLVGVFPYSVSTRQIPASRSMHPSRWLPPLEKTQFEQGWPGSLLDPSISTDVWVCLHYWVVIWVAG